MEEPSLGNVIQLAVQIESLQGIVESCYCPISVQIMRDPVLPDCQKCIQTCDRPSLEQWFARGKTSCPLCGHNHLLSNRIRPNAALRYMIEALQSSGILSGDHGNDHSSTYPDGSKYGGFLKNGQPHGRGKMVYASGCIYDGEWVDGNFHGHGVYTWPDGAKYKGEWKNDKRHGHGLHTWPNGEKYEGEWRNDNRHTRGYVFPNGIPIML